MPQHSTSHSTDSKFFTKSDAFHLSETYIIQSHIRSTNLTSLFSQEGGGLFDSLGNTPLLMGGLAAAGLGAFVLVENLALLATNNGDSQVIKSRSEYQISP